MNESGIRRALVVSFDRLHAGFIGCFGNDWIETPHFDRLATEAVVFDQHFCENLDPIAANHAWWTGRRQFPLDAKQQRESRSFVDQLHAWDVSTCLIVESDGGDDSTLAPPFGEVLTERGIDGFDAAEADTPFARLVQRCRLWLSDSARQPGAALLWIKSRGVPSPWVPPQAFGELYLDEFGLGDDVAEETEAGPEPTGSDSAIGSSEERVFGSGADGSIDWRYAAAMYAAYVTLIDRGLGRLLTAVRETPGWEQALLIVTAAAGQPLGEHAAIGAEMIPLRAESLHAPLWIQARGFDQAGTRRQALVQTIDVAPTLLDWFGGAAPGDMSGGRTESDVAGRSLLPLVRNQDASLRERLVMGHGRAEWAIRTPDFFYAEPGDRWTEAEDSKAVLFEKPHDRWDQCDVLAQYPQVAEELRARLRREIQGLQGTSAESED